MASQKMKVSIEGPVIVWRDRTTGATVFQFNAEDVTGELDAKLRMHAIKQILGDAMALPAGTSQRDKIASAMKAADTLRDGTWGTRKSSLPSAQVFRALVALGLLADTDVVREKWAKLTDAQRSAFAQRPDVTEWLAANTEVAEVDTDDILGDMLSD